MASAGSPGKKHRVYSTYMFYQSGRLFLQIPVPTDVPDKVLQEMAQSTINHRWREFANLPHEIILGLKQIFKISGQVAIFPASGTVDWEVALVNKLSPGDKVLMFEIGNFATLWRNMAGKLRLYVDFVSGDWRHGVDPSLIVKKLSKDRNGDIRRVALVHNETYTGVTSPIPEVRKAIDWTGHPALLMVETIFSLASVDYQHDAWGVDVTIGCSQMGLELSNISHSNGGVSKALDYFIRSNLSWLTNGRGGFCSRRMPLESIIGLLTEDLLLGQIYPRDSN